MANEIVGLRRFMPVSFEDNRAFHKIVLENRIKDFLGASDVVWLDYTAADLSSVDRGSFSTIKSPTYIWAGSTFDDLYYSVLMGGNRVTRREDIVRRVSYVSRIVIDGGEGMLPSDVQCSQGLNCLIGPSGSGKTLMLDIIKNKLKGEHLSVDTSSSGCYEGLYDLDGVHLYDADGNEIDASAGYEIVEGENLYNRVIKAYSGNLEELTEELGLSVDASGFYKMANEFENGANAYLAKLAGIDKLRKKAGEALAQAWSAARFISLNDATHTDTIAYTRDSSLAARVTSLEDTLATCKDDIKRMEKSFETLLEIATRNGFSEETIKAVSKLRSEFFARLEAKRLDTDVQLMNVRLAQARQSLIYDACQAYNRLISGQFQQVVEKKQVLADRLSDVASALIERRTQAYELEAPFLDAEELQSSVKLKSENPAARLNIVGLNLTIAGPDELCDVFPKNVNRQRAAKGKTSAQAFDYPYDLCSQESVASLLAVFSDAGLTDGLTVALDQGAVVNSKVELKNEKGEFMPLNSFSAGMLSKVYVEHFLDEAIANAGSSTMILYDQPESNMEKEFLLKVLGGKFAELRKTHQIFVATHEPLLVVNADANEIILASNDKRVDQPNRVKYENRSFVGANGEAELVEEVARLIDGGSDAVVKRSEIYEGMA